MKHICLFAMIVVIAVNSVNSREIAPPVRVVRAADLPLTASEDDTNNQGTAAASDDLDNAETFGFGFHKHVHVHGGYGGPEYYPYAGYYPHPGHYGYGYGHPYYY
ncbi:uncharacterized protein LOC129771465 [Toxorhynchites rutilus septentrionalis]|uniref:uncharacterized protein LOC129771465 n=1 Tax=Toxorhynchites rutilus septentrionalis TaxID=329112 RepID=UPI00247AC973|nr:uncharacterized protein LOC129771465 [Toxorhynchites rutilus septentrionalis]